jgi:hypothetical protein
MNILAAVLLALAAGTLPSAAITGFFMFKVNRATATKTVSESEGVEAHTAEVFTRLAAEWTKRADERVAKLETRINTLVTAIENLTDAVDGVTPLLEPIVTSQDATEKVAVLRSANRVARRIAG